MQAYYLKNMKTKYNCFEAITYEKNEIKGIYS